MGRPGVLFDVDGTLLDTNWLHTVAWWRAFREVGRDVPMVDIHHCVGMGGARLMHALLGEAEDRAEERYLAHYRDVLRLLRPLPGAAELVRAVARRGVAPVLATSAPKEQLDAIRTALRVDDVLAGVTSADDVASSKPAPDVFAVAAEEAGIDLGACVVVGDTVWDVQAAGRLGVPSVALLSGGNGEPELRAAGAAAVYDGPQALLDCLDDSPIGQLLTSP